MANFYRLDAESQRRIAFRRLTRYLRTIVGPYHPAFRETCRTAGIDPLRISNYEDFRRIPFVTKQLACSDPKRYVLQPVFPGKESDQPTTPIAHTFLLKYLWQALANRPALMTELFKKQTLKEKIAQRACREWLPIHFHASAGSTGNPTPAVYTHYDLTEVASEVAASALVRPDDPQLPPFRWENRRLSLMPGAPHLAFFQTVFGKLFLGLSIFDTFGGKVIPTQRQIEIFSDGNFSTLIAVPSYLVYWMRKAVEMVEAGQIAPFGQRFNSAAVGAEPISAALRARIHQLAAKLGAHPGFQIVETFGMTEMKWAGIECAEGAGIHLNPKFFFWELLHPETKEPVAPGEPGVLVFSHIGWRGTVFIRYWTGDLIQGGMIHDRCPRCGYTFVRIRSPIVRVDKDFTKIKGTLIALQELVTTIRDTPGVRNCQVILENEASGRDRMVVRILPEPNSETDRLASAVRENIKMATEVTADEVLLETEEETFEKELFGRTGIKADFVIERRSVHGGEE